MNHSAITQRGWTTCEPENNPPETPRAICHLKDTLTEEVNFLLLSDWESTIWLYIVCLQLILTCEISELTLHVRSHSSCSWSPQDQSQKVRITLQSHQCSFHGAQSLVGSPHLSTSVLGEYAFSFYIPNQTEFSNKDFKYFIWHVRYNNENEIVFNSDSTS